MRWALQSYGHENWAVVALQWTGSAGGFEGSGAPLNGRALPAPITQLQMKGAQQTAAGTKERTNRKRQFGH